MVQANPGAATAQPAKDKYKKVEKLGQGGCGTAWLVRSLITHQLWVIKTVNFSELPYEERLSTKKEARILEVLNHPNIIKFKDVFKSKNKEVLNVVMEYADGGDLAHEISRRKRENDFFTEDQILNYFTQICLAIKHCHDRRILHRDLKAGNIFLTRRGIAKLGDFGISRVLSGTKSRVRTVIGTPLYLSPEILSQKPYNGKSDIWALGVLLYEMAALKSPWTAKGF